MQQGSPIPPLVGRVELELREMNLSARIPDAQSMIPALLQLGVEDGTDGLLEITDTGDGLRVVRYNVKAIIVGTISILGGFHAGLIGAVVALAGLWQLLDARESLSPAACLIVLILARDGDLVQELLNERFREESPALLGNIPSEGAFAAVLTTLESKGVIRRRGLALALNESFHINED